MANVIFVSYDGMTDPLGQSQVIPYLQGLAALGHSIRLVSFEKKERFAKNKDRILSVLEKGNIRWHPQSYTKFPPVLSTLKDVRQMKRVLEFMHRQEPADIIHCRSYIAALAGLEIKRRFRTKFLFDMRGFWADERVEGGIWNLSNPVFRMVYNYFKKKEQEFLGEADHIISLTQNAADEIHQWKFISNQPVPITVIPCCADLDLFSPQNISKENVLTWKSKLKIADNDFVVSYVGSLGTWYLASEMMRFFSRILVNNPSAKFLVISPDAPALMMQYATAFHVPAEKIIFLEAGRNEVPELLSLSKLSLFFIRQSFSKKASSPVKQGEIMAIGIPVICNSGVGDTDKILQESGAGIVLNDLSEPVMDNAVSQIDSLLKIPAEKIRQGAEKYFSLKEGVRRYHEVYKFLKPV